MSGKLVDFSLASEAVAILGPVPIDWALAAGAVDLHWLVLDNAGAVALQVLDDWSKGFCAVVDVG